MTIWKLYSQIQTSWRAVSCLWRKVNYLKPNVWNGGRNYDIEEMLREMGYTNGVENYSRHMDGRRRWASYTSWFLPGDFDYDWRESRWLWDKSRAYTVETVLARKKCWDYYGFRLPSALDVVTLRQEEFESHVHQIVYVSAAPGDYEWTDGLKVIEQIIRPTGLWTQRWKSVDYGTDWWPFGWECARVEKNERTFITHFDLKRNGRGLDRLLQRKWVSRSSTCTQISRL